MSWGEAFLMVGLLPIVIMLILMWIANKIDDRHYKKLCSEMTDEQLFNILYPRMGPDHINSYAYLYRYAWEELERRANGGT